MSLDRPISLDRAAFGLGKLANALAGVALIVGLTGCGGDNPPPQAANTPTPSASPAAPSPSPTAAPSTTGTSTGEEDDSDSSSSSTGSTKSTTSTSESSDESTSETPTGSSQPADITCATFNSLGVGSQRDTLSRIAKANPGSPLEKFPDAYLNNVRATCSQQSNGGTKVLDVLALDGTKYRAQ